MESISSEFVQLSARTFGTSTKHFRTSPKVCRDGWYRQATRRVTRCTKTSIVGAPGVAKNYNWDNDGLRDIEYEPIWGTQYVRKMIQRHEALGLSNNGVAVVMLGYFFVYVHVHSLPRSFFALLFRHEGCRNERRPRDRCLPNTVLWQTPF